VIAVRGKNAASDEAGVRGVMLELKRSKKSGDFIVTDETWLSSAQEEKGWQNLAFDDSAWTKGPQSRQTGATSLGAMFLKVPKATSAESLTVLPGFKVELVHSAGDRARLVDLHDG